MDVINEQQFKQVIIDPMLDRLKNEIIPALEAAVQTQLDSALAKIDHIGLTAGDSVVTAASTLTEAVADLRKLVESLDGTTVTVSVPDIVVTLHLPEAK